MRRKVAAEGSGPLVSSLLVARRSLPAQALLASSGVVATPPCARYPVPDRRVRARSANWRTPGRGRRSFHLAPRRWRPPLTLRWFSPAFAGIWPARGAPRDPSDWPAPLRSTCRMPRMALHSPTGLKRARGRPGARWATSVSLLDILRWHLCGRCQNQAACLPGLTCAGCCVMSHPARSQQSRSLPPQWHIRQDPWRPPRVPDASV